ncbi:hypothetical protein J0H33_03720 [bacterium]|nr:hypothetical protein [bacterium]
MPAILTCLAELFGGGIGTADRPAYQRVAPNWPEASTDAAVRCRTSVKHREAIEMKVARHERGGAGLETVEGQLDNLTVNPPGAQTCTQPVSRAIVDICAGAMPPLCVVFADRSP